jgi:hypothetical protein
MHTLLLPHPWFSKRIYRGDDVIDLFVGQFRENRQAHAPSEA